MQLKQKMSCNHEASIRITTVKLDGNSDKFLKSEKKYRQEFIDIDIELYVLFQFQLL
jgi:hypothetical protein